MAIYTENRHFRRSSGFDISEAFRKKYQPGTRTTFSGIYRCDLCGSELVCKKGDVLPFDHQHTHSMRPAWTLLMIAEERSDK